MANHDDDIIYPATIPFVMVHLACLGALWSGVTAGALITMVALYVVRMWAVTAGYHRYFSHRSFKTGRVFQFLLAWLAQSSTQKSVLWWAAKHRHHHKFSDQPEDVHSPVQHGFFYSHVGWIFSTRHDDLGNDDLENIPDLTRYPELVFLKRFEQLPSLVLAVACFALGGWPGLIVGFFWSTVLLYHGTFFINSLAHVHGKVRYVTGDDSRNNWWLALITLGEGWHNNHHAYQRSVRQGFRWYEVDITWYVLVVLSWVGLVWDMGKPPADVVANQRPLGRATLEKVARQLAASFHERFPDAHLPTRDALAARLPHLPTRDELVARLPAVPTREELAARAREMFDGHTVSFDDIVARAHDILADWRASAELKAAEWRLAAGQAAADLRAAGGEQPGAQPA